MTDPHIAARLAPTDMLVPAGREITTSAVVDILASTAVDIPTSVAAVAVPADDDTTSNETGYEIDESHRDGWRAAGWAEAAREYHADRKCWQNQPAQTESARVELLLLRIQVHGPEIVYEPDNFNLLRGLHHQNPVGFQEVCAELDEFGVQREHLVDAISPVPVIEGLSRAVALTPRGRRLGVFQAVARVATELVHTGVLKKADAVDQLMAIAQAHGSHPSHLGTCEQVVRTVFAEGAKS